MLNVAPDGRLTLILRSLFISQCPFLASLWIVKRELLPGGSPSEAIPSDLEP